MKLKYLAFLLFLALFFSNSTKVHSQLSGYYTVGGVASDYTSLYSAIYSLCNDGINGDVTFALSPGTYSSVTITEIPGASANNTFTLQSMTLDSNDVYIQGGIYIDWASYISVDAITISNPGGIAFESSNHSENINISNCSIIGEVELYHPDDSDIKNNIFNGILYLAGIDSVISNSFFSSEDIYITASYFYNNYFCDQLVKGFGWKFVNNYFEGPLRLNFATSVKMIGNIFLDDIQMSFNDVFLFEKNIMYGNLNYGEVTASNWDYQIQNNIFFNGRLRAGGHNSKIRYNNFVDSAYLYLNYTNIKVYGNNFCRSVEGAFNLQNIHHNNYYPQTYNSYDTTSTNYDPCYDSMNPGVTTNPILQGKGWSQTPTYDFFGNLRKNPPAVGANEIYICSDSMNNIINVPCGEDIYLNLCNLPDSGDFWWTPDTCVLSPNSSYTSVSAFTSSSLYLNNSYFGVVDSVFIQVEPFEVEIAEMPIFYCGYARTLNVSYHPHASYSWSPIQGLTNPNIRTPLLLIEDTMNLQYFLECNIPGCGLSYDTLNIDYNPLPYIIMYYPQQTSNYVNFSCTGTCIDEFYWDFGDNTYSYDQNNIHYYEYEGFYTITLIGSNSFGNDTVIYENFYFNLLSSPELDEYEKVQIYPNPVKNRIYIKGLPNDNLSNMILSNMAGEILININTRSNETSIDINDLTQGVYILQIKIGTDIFTKKIIVLD